VKQLPILIITVALAAGGAQACSRGERRQGGPEATADTRTPAEGVTSASAERQIITLTGCLKRDVQPGTYALMSVATAGVVDDGNRAQQERRRDMKAPADKGRPAAAGTDTTTAGSAATLASGSSFRLVAANNDQQQEMAKYENKRVAVRGRLAAETPVGTSGTAGSAQAGSGGRVVDSSPTNATVAGSAPTLRAVHVESVRQVGESCTAQ